MWIQTFDSVLNERSCQTGNVLKVSSRPESNKLSSKDLTFICLDFKSIEGKCRTAPLQQGWVLVKLLLYLKTTEPKAKFRSLKSMESQSYENKIKAVKQNWNKMCRCVLVVGSGRVRPHWASIDGCYGTDGGW